jgi:hypothetical protein
VDQKRTNYTIKSKTTAKEITLDNFKLLKMKSSIIKKRTFLIYSIAIILSSCGHSAEYFKNLDCSSSQSDYEKGLNIASYIKIASDGRRDCNQAFKFQVEMNKSLGLSAGEKTDCWCKGFYDGYDRK